MAAPLFLFDIASTSLPRRPGSEGPAKLKNMFPSTNTSHCLGQIWGSTRLFHKSTTWHERSQAISHRLSVPSELSSSSSSSSSHNVARSDVYSSRSRHSQDLTTRSLAAHPFFFLLSYPPSHPPSLSALVVIVLFLIHFDSSLL